jgi:quinolinate synthase
MNYNIKIEELKNKTDSIILAHNYQLPEIQDVADFVGDSLDLSIRAKKSKAENIIFCGVSFMAESAKILNPDKNVIIPDLNAKCPMAEKIDKKKLETIINQNKDAELVSYINTTAEIKAISDICCTSSNGINVIKSLNTKKIIFVPDKNLGNYIKKFVPEKKMIIWPGICPTHNRIHKNHIKNLKNKHKNAEILVHPECRPEIIEISDYVLSTNGMVNHVKNSKKSEFIIGTEKELCYRLKKENPKKLFYPVETAICHNMKKITIEKLLNCLINKEPEIIIENKILEKAREPLEKMMKIKRGD